MPNTGTRKKLADLGAVASGLAHEIRNPLNSLSINSQILVEMLSALPGVAPDRKEELLSLAHANMKVTRRLNDILTEFLRFARPPSMELVVADLTRIAAVIYVERAGQKGILIGSGGEMLKKIGTEARLGIEQMLGRKVFLDLRVRLEPDWRENPRLLDADLDKQLKANPLPQKYPRTKGVYGEFIEAIKNGTQPGSNIPGHAGPLTEMIVLGNLAVRAGRSIELNPTTGELLTTGIPAEWVSTPFRAGYSL